MRDFSIDLQAEKIYSAKTKTYFSEVIKSYYSESYRSAIVMLYSITIADLLFKLEELKDLYDDDSAKAILREIEIAKENPKSLSEWESLLVEKINKQTNLFAPEDFVHIKTLREHRHLCAHPVMTEHYELYQPNRETVRAHIRNMLEGVLVKPAILSKKVLDSLLEDLADKKRLLNNDQKLENFLGDRYLKRFNLKVKLSVFRSLWKIIFKLNDVKSDQNRNILYRTLSHLLKIDYNNYLLAIEAEKDYYSDIAEEQFYLAATLFNRNPSIYLKLSDTFKTLFHSYTQRNANMDAFCVFLSADVKEHMDKILDMNTGWESPYEYTTIHTETISEVVGIGVLHHHRDEAFGFLIEMFSYSNQYAQADDRYDQLIKPNLDKFTQAELILILKKMNSNNQISGRRKGSITKQEVSDVLKMRFNIEDQS
ncbi:hypothetical protein [Pedobacter soli]|uniref:Uncharacterized protein n=1 Tax=Pedobacter soli TaxID=390242 RepID=A0A1G6WP04_9SPHI|nr:hypothetical protein [Pedobacter soli]SDD67541.1 hypothetical protein SAMN04488024_10778 [Pedobacter soli]